MSMMRNVLAGVVCLLAAMITLGQNPGQTKAGEQFVILVHESAEEFKLRTDQTDKGRNYWKKWGEFRDQLEKAGVLRGGLPLARASAGRILKVQDGKQVVAEVPAGKIEWSGFFIVEVKDLDAALAWAAKVPNVASSHVEVRSGDPIVMAAMKK